MILEVINKISYKTQFYISYNQIHKTTKNTYYETAYIKYAVQNVNINDELKLCEK